MCVTQRYSVIYPDGHREPRERLYWCPRGTPNCPCNQTEIVDLFEDEIAVPPEAPPAPQPRYQVIEPRAVRRQPQPEAVRYRKKPSDGLKAVWDIHIPFTSCNKKSKPQEKKIVIRERERIPRPGLRPPIIHPPPPPPPPPLPPIRGPPIMLGLFPRPAGGQNELAQERECRRRAERIAREEHEARIRAQKEADKVRRQRDREKKRNSDLERNRNRLEQERRDCAASAERQRRRNDEERARAESRERARRAVEAVRHQVEEQIAHAELRVRARLWTVEAVRRHEEERAWRQEEQEDARLEEERERIARRVQQMIPREPRHPPVIHQFCRGSFEARGDRVIDNAIINAEERRQAEGRDGWFRRRSVGGGHRRRDQAAVGERRIFEDDLRRVGLRFF